MTRRRQLFRLVWLSIAVVLGYASLVGGDTAILGGWLFMVWTLPVGIMWWFCVYPNVRDLVGIPIPVFQIIGETIVIAIAFVFWFLVFPRVGRISRRRPRSTNGP
jgi:hypothetical protein